MLNKVLPSFFSADSTGNTSISSGGTAEHLNANNEQQAISKLSAIPHKVTEKQVNEIAKVEGNIECNVELMKLWSQRALSAQSQALAGMDVRINHAQQSIKNEENYRSKLSKHGKNVLIHNVTNSAINENLNAYQAALNSASATVKI